MRMTFYKYQGTGNDFIIIDNRQLLFDKNDTNFIARLCDRRFGIGADGLILLEHHDDVDFKMIYFNADGRESSMCGNGGRCIVHFANFLGIIAAEASFEAIDGLHEAVIKDDIISLKMNNVNAIIAEGDHVVLDTGSPHFIAFEDDIARLDMNKEGAAIRYSAPYKDEGINVNFVQPVDGQKVHIRTYERGVEAETLSCGTGVTAAALAYHYTNQTTANEIELQTEGGVLRVSFDRSNTGYTNIWLTGPATQVFKGDLS